MRQPCCFEPPGRAGPAGLACAVVLAGTLTAWWAGRQATGADAVLAASVFHYGQFTVRQVKEYLQSRGVEVRF